MTGGVLPWVPEPQKAKEERKIFLSSFNFFEALVPRVGKSLVPVQTHKVPGSAKIEGIDTANFRGRSLRHFLVKPLGKKTNLLLQNMSPSHPCHCLHC